VSRLQSAVSMRTPDPAVKATKLDALATTTMVGFAPLADHSRSTALGRDDRAEVWSRRPITGVVTGTIIVLDPPARLQPRGRWAAYQDLGIVAPEIHGFTSRVVAGAYKVLGFGILAVIVTVLVSYVGSIAFYTVSSSWIAPAVVSPFDPKIVALRTQLATARNQRDKIVADMHDAERTIARENVFARDFARSITVERSNRWRASGKLRALASNALASRNQIRLANEDFARTSSEKLHLDYDRHLVDQRAMMGGTFQLAQISSELLSLSERQAGLERQASELAQQGRSLDHVLAHDQRALSYDVLAIKRGLDASGLELARAIDTKVTLAASLVRQDAIISALESSSYLRALNDGAMVALVPYGNLAQTTPGTRLYACKLAMVWCRDIGSIIQVLPGEVAFKHPKRDTQMRGRLVELRLDDAEAGRNEVLFAARPPLGV